MSQTNLEKTADLSYVTDKSGENYGILKKSLNIIRISKSKKNRQHSGQKKKYKRTNNDLQNIHIKLKTPNGVTSLLFFAVFR
jgi:hypothetical protein